MEGRTIVRPVLLEPLHPPPDTTPLQWRAGQSSGQSWSVLRLRRNSQHPFNGGPDNRPASPRQQAVLDRVNGAFNGGPDNRPASRDSIRHDRNEVRTFNGGPDNRPASHGMTGLSGAAAATFNGGPDNRPASRPVSRAGSPRPGSFNGGPDNRPASPSPSQSASSSGVDLQWRAGQSSGQSCPPRVDDRRR